MRDNTTRLHINLIIYVYKFDSILNLIISYKSPWRSGRGRDDGARGLEVGRVHFAGVESGRGRGGRGAAAWRGRGGRRRDGRGCGGRAGAGEGAVGGRGQGCGGVRRGDVEGSGGGA
jgi:hypothetical protein